MAYIKITPINQLGSDQRGSTYEYCIRESKNFILIKRNANTMSGNSYHQGTTYGTNPKTFILLDGKINFHYRHIDETNHQTKTIDKPTIIEVESLVAHAVEALTNITMLECNSITDIQQDRVRCDVAITA